MTTLAHPLAEDYLRQLDSAARVLPRRQREELLAEIRSHLDTGLPPEATEADVRNLLDDLGTPEQIVAFARPDRPPAKRGSRELLALLFLVVGFLPLFGWLLGVVLLVSSPLWSTRQKLLGLLVWPGGLATLLAVGQTAVSVEWNFCPVPVDGWRPPGDSPACLTTGSYGWPYTGAAVLAFLVLSQLLVAGYLWRAAGRRAETA